MDRLAWGFGLPVGVTLVTMLSIFLISRLLLVFNDAFIATAIALVLGAIIVVAAVFLARGSSGDNTTATH